jgi:hypothetical protein
MEINTIFDRIEDFLRKYETEQNLFYSGQKKELDLYRIYKEYDNLFNLDILREINEKDLNKKEVKYLKEFLFTRYLNMRSEKDIDKVETIMLNEKIRLSNGEEISLPSACIKQINERDRKLRFEIESKKKRIYLKNNSLLGSIHDRTFEVIKEIGEDNPISLFEKISHINTSYHSKVLKDFIDKTEDTYSSALEEVVGKYLNINVGESQYFDMGYLGRNADFDINFPSEGMLDIIKETILEMGLDFTANGNITFDLYRREGKSTFGFYSPIKIPEQIILVFVPLGGVKDYGEFLHELGHALHFGYTNHKLPIAFKRLGDNSVSEGYASLFDHLIYNPHWLEYKLELKGDDLKHYMKIMWTHKTYLLRMYIAEFFYDLLLWKDSELAGKEKIYSKYFLNITKIKFPQYLYLNEISSYFGIIRYIRAEILEAAIFKYLEENFGNMWFKNKSTGKFLIRLWQNGQKYSAEEILKELGFENKEAVLLIERVNEIFNEIRK